MGSREQNLLVCIRISPHFQAFDCASILETMCHWCWVSKWCQSHVSLLVFSLTLLFMLRYVRIQLSTFTSIHIFPLPCFPAIITIDPFSSVTMSKKSFSSISCFTHDVYHSTRSVTKTR